MALPLDSSARLVAGVLFRSKAARLSRAALGVLVGALPLRAAEPTELAVDPAVEEAFLGSAGPGFQLERTAHFLICYNGDARTLRDFVARVEATHRSAERFLDQHEVPLTAPEGRLQIYFFDRFEEFHQYALQIGADAAGAAGFYHPGTNRAAFYNAVNAPRLADVNRRIEDLEEALRAAEIDFSGERREMLLQQLQRLRNERAANMTAINQLVVQHEVAHQYFYNAGLHVSGADNPAWFVEGLACLFESPLGPRGAGLGVVNQYRLLNFREALAGTGAAAAARPEDFAGACRAERLVPLERLMTDGTLFDTTRPNVENIYAETWSLVHYLQRRRRRELGEYLRGLSRRPLGRRYAAGEELELFEAAFGPLDESFTAKWLAYTLDLRVQLP